ncbi:acyl transferase domain-containing protein [Prosthecobacter fusiformis]|uniref:Acyl transferase domain-containing protein n=1 Tax=Prosthecobacter fusiformis TaxID=48464 RepID=A0A4R7STS1_9BACT|nr:type I polyketide synthase [Prosthecobacter fusiformis]TDU81697.1 acyl transferase domain-containing protein [Prosthecobacter fusiformis]
MHKEGIAIIGIGCRFPGGINDVEAFWKLLAEGRDAVCEIPPDRWNIERYYDAEPGLAGKSIAKRGGFLDSIDQYDPQFFGISPREAPYVDPQQRLVLETAWEAIEDAGIVLDLENGTDIGVFVGVSHTDYQVIQGTPFDSVGIGAHSSTGSAHSIAANRISYSLNLTGPSMSMDTACSSALTAVHAACEHIWTGRGTTALAGGVTVMITPGGFIGFSQASMLSPDGMCKAFDADANGFVRAEGAGMVMLKKLSQAIADGDPIQGVILGTSTNQDGHTNGISLPSPEAQARLVKDACKDAGISPSEIGYIEAHGTGTAVGDPIEATALSEALCADREEDAPLAMGSVKTNLGHMETAAGVAGLVKALLVLKHGQIPPSLHFKTPNPHIDFQALKLRIPTTMEDFPETYAVRMAGVNSFGFGGANSHVIVAEAPAKPHVKMPASAFERPWPLVISARSEEALKATAFRLSTWIEDHEKSNGTSPVLPDLAYTLGARRNHHQHRLTMVARTSHEAIATLNAFGVGQEVPNVRSGFSPRREKAARVGFVMSGQGPQWWGMGRELMKNEPVFSKSMEACAEALKPWAKFSLLEELARDEKDSKMSMTEIAQPAIFAMQVSLSELWKSWGVQPAAIVGHSVGEIAAACVAGVLSLEEGAKVIALRARFMNGCARGAGTMLAVGLDEDAALAAIAKHDRVVSIAAFNGPRSLTLSGPKTSLEAIQSQLEAEGVFARFVRVDHPFHHAYMQPAADELVAALADLKPRDETVPFFSTVTGAKITGSECDAGHWGRGIRQAVMFAPAVNALADFGVDVWLEITAHPALSLSIQECLGARGMKAPVVASARRDREHEAMLEAALELHRACVDLDFKGMTPSRHQLSLPTYAWDKARWWNESPDWREGRLGSGGKGLLDVRLPRATPTWIARLDNRHMAFLKDHKVESHVIFPAAGFVELILEAGTQYFEGRPFAVEDFEIRKPLILTENPSGVVLEVTYDPNERTFTIQSKFDQGAAWSVHVVGSMRGERTESNFNTSTWEGSTAGLTSLDVTDFYQHMSDLGLRYGDEFRAVRELWAAGGKAAGKVALSENISHRAGEYCLHPVLLDGALHTFSAGSKTVEDRKAKMKLPVRFGRILYLRSPGAVTHVQAKVVQFNDEFIEGNIGLYDASGKPCVLVDGFRAVSMAAARRAGTSGTRDLLYHVDWERTETAAVPSPLAPIPLAELKQAAQKTLEEVISVRGKTKLEATMAAEDDLAAAQIARGLSQMASGLTAKDVWTVETLKVAEPMRRVYKHLVNDLAKRGLLEAKGDGHLPTAKFATAADSATAELNKFIALNPGHLPEGMLCSITCAELGPILRGEKDAVQVLFGGSNSDLLDQFYGDGLLSSHWMAAITSAVNEASRKLPEGRGLRILEVGAGTAGLSAYLLPLLPRGLHSYTFTDVSAGFFPQAAQKLAAFSEVEFKVFNLEQSGLTQGFEADSYDLVIGTNVIHAVADVRATLGYIHELLKPGGSLVFMDVATPQLWTESVFGLTSGWWHLTDRELRPDQPLMQRPQWEAAMKEAGFAETTSIPGLTGPRGGEGQIGLFGRKAWKDSVTTPASEPTIAPATEQSWLVFADKGGLGDQLAARLQSAGIRVRIARRGSEYTAKGNEYTVRADTPADWMTLVTSYADDAPPERMTYLWSLDEPAGRGEGDSALMGIDALLHLTQAIENTTPAAKLRMDLITRGAQPAGQHMGLTNVAQAPSIGVFRVILSEHPNFACRGLDLPPEVADTDSALLWRELLQEHGEREIAIRGEARYVQRIKRGLPVQETTLDRKIPLRLESRERGMLDTLKLTAFSMPVCGDGEVLIEVKAAGMNFRDVLKALALYPAETPDARIFGDEVGGIVVAAGKNVKHVAVGDRVFGLAVYGLSTHTLARGGDVVKIPEGLSFEDAATIPVVFMTSWHALNNVARMRKGEKILIHAGAGGVGMSAIQIALHLGCEVIATAGSASKRALLETLGVKHVVDSRRADFADAVMELTNRKGVDVVLNALAGEAIPMGLSCLSEFGRFIEIGKRDIYQNSRIPLWHLRKNSSFHVVAMDAVFGGDEELTRNLLGEVVELVEKGALRPLPFRAYPACRVDAAFRLMAAGKHIGKVVVTFADAFVNRRGEAPVPGFDVKADGTYLITGGFGGFGRVLSEWLVDCGARNLVLASRSGPSTPEAKDFLDSLAARGVNAQVVKADAGEPADVTRMLQEIEKAGVPLKGIFHLAMVIDDAPMGVLNRERMRTVLAPKALGAWMLHEGTLDQNLDCFVMFSSISSVFGNPAQSNYSGANAFLDSLAHHRRALGLPALTINWGVLGGEGYVARNERVAEFLARQGTSAITPGEVISLLETFLTAGSAQVAAIRVDWAKWRQSFRGLQENPLLEHIFSSGVESAEAGGMTGDWRAKIDAAPADERAPIIAQALREVVGSVLRVKADSLRDDQPLTDLGLDSLMGVEIENLIESTIGVALPPTSLMRARTIGQLAALIGEHLGGASSGTAKPAAAPAVVEAPTSVDEVDLDAISDDDIASLLDDVAEETPAPASKSAPKAGA